MFIGFSIGSVSCFLAFKVSQSKTSADSLNYMVSHKNAFSHAW